MSRIVQDINVNEYIELNDVSVPANPANGKGRLYKKTGDDGIFWKPDSAGPEVDLTPVALRDYGQVYMDNNVTTTAQTQNTPVKIAGATTGINISTNFTAGTNRLTYTGTPTKIFHITVVLSAEMVSGPDYQEHKFWVYKNGVVSANAAICDQKLFDGYSRAVPLTALIQLATNDYVEAWSENLDNNNDLRVCALSLVATEV